MNLHIRSIIENEFRVKSLGVTEQYLEIHRPVYNGETLVIERVDRDKPGQTIVYIPVEGEQFYFAVYLNAEEEAIIGIGTEAWNRVYFTATSENLTLNEIAAMTWLVPTETWSKGELRKTGKSIHTFSAFKILPNPEPDEFEDKLEKLLTLLEPDRIGVLRLSSEADAYIMAAMNIHNANGMIGGPILSKAHIKRLADLNLSISFDIYLEGESLT